jgi:hypothetical protein
MSLELASAYVQIIPSLRGAGSKIQSELGGVGSSAGVRAGGLFAGSFTKALAPLAGIAAAALGAGAVTGFLKDSIQSASDLQQSLGGVDAVFGKSAKQIHDWAEQAQTSVGLSENAYNGLAAVIGSQLKNGGVAIDKIGAKTDDLIHLGADLAATFGGTTTDAVESITAAFRGERDPIEKYGVSLNQAQVDAEAAALGFKKVGGSLSTQANQAATLALILKQTSAAQGQFGKQTNTLAEQQQILAAQFENVKSKIGTAFLPAITAIVSAVSRALGPALKVITPYLTSLATQMQSVGTKIDGIDITAFATGFVGALKAVQQIASQVVPPLVAAFVRLGPAVAQAAASIGPSLGAAFATLGPALASVIPQLAAAATQILPSLVQIILALAPLIPPLASVISSLAPAIGAIAVGLQFLTTNVIAPLLGQLSLGLQAFSALANGMSLANFAAEAATGKFGVMLQSAVQLGNGIHQMSTEIGLAILGVIQFFTDMQSKVSTTVTQAAVSISGFAQNAGAAISRFVTNAIAFFARFAAGISAKVGEAVNIVRTIPGRVQAVIGNVGNILFSSGQALIRGFISGITSMIGAAGNAVSGVLSHVASFLPHSPAERGPFSGAGWRQVGKSGQALAAQFTGGFDAGVKDFGGSLRSFVPDTISSNISGSLAATNQGPSMSVLINNKTNVRLEDLIDVRVAKNDAEAERAFRLGYQPAVLGA